MDHRDWISIDDIARVEGSSYKTVQKRLFRAHAIYKNDDADGRRRLYPITVLSPNARQVWLSEQASLTNHLQEVQTSSGPTSHRPENQRSPETVTGVGADEPAPGKRRQDAGGKGRLRRDLPGRGALASANFTV
jgi:hypothetical protein